MLYCTQASADASPLCLWAFVQTHSIPSSPYSRPKPKWHLIETVFLHKTNSASCSFINLAHQFITLKSIHILDEFKNKRIETGFLLLFMDIVLPFHVRSARYMPRGDTTSGRKHMLDAGSNAASRPHADWRQAQRTRTARHTLQY